MATAKPKLKVSKRSRAINPISVFLVLFLAAALFTYLKTYPSYLAIQETKIEIDAMKDKIVKAQKNLSEELIKNKNLKPTDEEILREKQIPSDSDVTNLMRYLEKITPYEKTPNIEKIDLKSISIKEMTVSKKDRKTQKTGTVSIAMSFNSSKDAFRNLLTELERSNKRIFTITDIAISETNTGPLVERGKYSLTMIAYNQLN